MKSVWKYIKKYWYLFVIALLTILLFVLGNNSDFAEILKEKTKQLSKEIKSLETHNNNITEGRDENLDAYLETMNRLEKEYNKKEADIKKEVKEQIGDFIKESNSDPEEVAKRIAEENGWEYVK